MCQGERSVLSGESTMKDIETNPTQLLEPPTVLEPPTAAGPYPVNP